MKKLEPIPSHGKKTLADHQHVLNPTTTSHSKMTFADHQQGLKQVSVKLDDMLLTFDVMARHGVIDELEPIGTFMRLAAFGKARVSQSRLDQGQRNAFNNAVQKDMQSGEYQRIAAIHLSATKGTGHDAHGFTGTAFGRARFLPWHRAYLLENGKRAESTRTELQTHSVL